MEDNISAPLKRGGIADLPLLETLLAIRQKSKAFIKKGTLEEMEGVNDNATAFMHLNMKANK